ncbi:alpha/beta hydrolase family protein [Microbispora sp. NPDC004025]
MTISRKAAALAAAFALVLPAPASASAPPKAPIKAPGTPVRTEPLAESLRLAGAGTSLAIWYRSTGHDGRPTVVSGTLALPAGRPPAGGWPVVSFGHGFGGIADACAPSRTGPSPWERAVQETLLAAGYAVAVSDYEGLGTPGDSPGIDGRSEAYDLVDIVRAARRVAPVSRNWASVGYSMGGHAALFAGALAAAYAPSLRHMGTIAMAPITQWGVQTADPAFRDPAKPINHTIPYNGRTMPLTTPGFRAADWFTPKGLELVDLAGRACIGEMIEAVAGLTNGDVLKDPAAATDAFARALADDEIPVARYPRPVYVVHGTEDVIPIALSRMTAGQLRAAGTDVTFVPVEGADHITLLPAIATRVREWTDRLFRRR